MLRQLLALACVLAGCASDEDASSGDPPSACPSNQWLRPDGVCVTPGIPADLPCPPGEQLRDGACIPAGILVDGCSDGFVHDGDRGCDPILPDTDCADGLMAVPGETACREIAPCGSGVWGDIPVDASTEYVDASY